MNQENKTQYIFGNFFKDFSATLSQQKTIFIVDENVFNIYKNELKNYFQIIIPSGEKFKNHETVNQIYSELIALEADRRTLLIGFGGGVCTDITGFVASTFMRGIKFGFVPTTLLAQVDASIGGKNGIDFLVYKNMVGTFNLPSFIFFDTSFLTSLPNAEWINGCAEIIKHACIADKQLFKLLENKQLNDLQFDNNFLLSVIQKNVSIKQSIVEKDPYEKGDRKLLNFGHTFGHAIENTYNLSHGNAVAIGISLACNISTRLSSLTEKEAIKIQNVIKKFGLPTTISYDIDKIFSVLKMDKKKENTDIHFVLLNTIGQSHSQKISFNNLYQYIKNSKP